MKYNRAFFDTAKRGFFLSNENSILFVNEQNTILSYFDETPEDFFAKRSPFRIPLQIDLEQALERLEQVKKKMGISL